MSGAQPGRIDIGQSSLFVVTGATASFAVHTPPRLMRAVEWLGLVALVVLPLLRPLVWSGGPLDTAGTLYLVLLAGGIAIGLLHQALTGQRLRRGPAFWLGVAVLAVCVVGCMRSDWALRSWQWWLEWTLHCLAPIALGPLIRRRPGLVVAGLVAGLAVEALIMGGQARWERPAQMAELAADPGLVELEAQRGQVAVRLSSWRLDGTFLLANATGTYFAMLLPLVAGCAWTAWRRWGSGADGGGPRPRAIGAAVLWTGFAAVAGVGLLRTGSKAAIIAVLAALALAALVSIRRLGWRWAAVSGCAAVLIAALTVPAVQTALRASAGVRLDYWRGALALITERPWVGHGMDGFHSHFPRVMPDASEPTIIVHNEYLQAAVDLGLPAAALFVLWCLVLLRRLRPAAAGPALPTTGLSIGQIAAVLGVIAWFLVGAGLLGERLRYWPSPDWWSALVADPAYSIHLFTVLAVAGLVLSALRQVPPLPTWAPMAGVAACLLHAAADFHLHSAQVVGTCAWLAGLGLACRRHAVLAPLTDPSPSLGRGLLALAILVAAAGGAWWAGERQDLDRRVRLAGDALHRVRRLYSGREDPERARIVLEAALHAYAIRSDDPEALRHLADRAGSAAAAVANVFPRDPDLARVGLTIAAHAAAIRPQWAADATARHLAAQDRWPDLVAFAAALSDHYAALARQPGLDASATLNLRLHAQQWMARAVDLYPVYLPFRASLAALARANRDWPIAEREEAAIARLAEVVHPDHRLRKGPERK